MSRLLRPQARRFDGRGLRATSQSGWIQAAVGLDLVDDLRLGHSSPAAASRPRFVLAVEAGPPHRPRAEPVRLEVVRVVAAVQAGDEQAARPQPRRDRGEQRGVTLAGTWMIEENATTAPSEPGSNVTVSMSACTNCASAHVAAGVGEHARRGVDARVVVPSREPPRDGHARSAPSSTRARRRSRPRLRFGRPGRAHVGHDGSTGALIAHLKLEIEKLRRALYGSHSERKARLLEQMELQLEDLEAAATEDELAAEKAAARTQTVQSFQRKRPSRKPFPDHLPHERIVIAAPESCPCCGSTKLSKLGEDITETLEVIPAR